ncbi:hypothetical protein HO133_010053 [Letharia lupina]|uniref:AB hydrolase-1 domain-containing protein n=1 Tax=Letharia lupina TaxID=560253 RepID=A0A8H6CKD1_9LECA|nr:uncharacterized protein HO133_010053 [Letharia lupina]KAF6224859.1 hypothetical protein HO133_010053 [Letharia lupina]
MAVLLLRPSTYRVPLVLEIWAIAETAFFALIYVPRTIVLQRAATHPELLPREQRRELFKLCLDTVEDPEKYLSGWMRGAPASEIKRENVKELFCWAFLNKKDHGPEDDDELEEYADETELCLGRRLEPGRGNAVSLRVTVDRFQSLHRSLLWYFCVFFVDTITFSSLIWNSFHFHSLPFSQSFDVFPLRPFGLLSKQKTPAKTLTYWHRPHTSKARLPILFIHGIGIGLYPYVNFLSQINKSSNGRDEDGDIGIIAIEIMSVSFRITGAALEKDQMCFEIQQILRHHGWHECILASHSYGSVISSHLLHYSETSQLFGPVLLIDPVSILLHLPDVAYNFTARKPIRANEHQLYYFASMDMGVAHTLGRRFFWAENILWKHDMDGRQVTVSLASRDLIVDTEAVGRYLAQDGNGKPKKEEWKHREWKGKGLDILWFDDLDHAQKLEWRERFIAPAMNGL